jgi:hypothetical protein
MLLSAAVNVIQKLGDRLVPVIAIRQVATNGVKPPKIVTAMAKLSDTPMPRVRVGLPVESRHDRREPCPARPRQSHADAGHLLACILCFAQESGSGIIADAGRRT